MQWPTSAADLLVQQQLLAEASPPRWTAPDLGALEVAGCFVCFGRGESGVGAAGDPGWAGAAVVTPSGGRPALALAIAGAAGAPYEPGILALREGPLLEAAVRRLPRRPEVLLVNATGRDHPRRAGLALHLGALLDLPTVGVTHRPLMARGAWPEPTRGAHAPLLVGGETVGYWVTTAARARPLAVHAAWRTDADTAAALALAVSSTRARTPEPIRLARRAARDARTFAETGGRLGRAAEPTGT